MTAYDDFVALVKENQINQAFDKAFNNGFDAGKKAEFDPAFNTGFKSGFKDGFQDGFQSGWRVNPKKPAPAGQFAMYDTIDFGGAGIPSDAPAVAGYVDGRWQSFGPLSRAYPNAKHLGIAVFPSDDAECLDVESGDATPGQAPDWVKRQHARGVARPVVYTSVSQVPAVAQALHDAGISRDQIKLWTAHYLFTPHLCTGISTVWGAVSADATQWTDHGPNGENYDESLCTDGFL